MSKKKEKGIEGPLAKGRKRIIHCQEPLVGASQVLDKTHLSVVAIERRSATCCLRAVWRLRVVSEDLVLRRKRRLKDKGKHVNTRS